ncbi:hypothetical protein [Achromobacter spanius]|uniref:hypothetical protein n=1 Tax=Achromobacter spanius TaxID=217203 RepID=UPI001319E1BF|nr:hypothetical protein [Achromobacter spanius]
MTNPFPDPLAPQHDGRPRVEAHEPVDAHTQRLQDENSALRELLAAQVEASSLRREPGSFKRLCWWLVSAPGTALIRWRTLLGRDERRPITCRRVGYAALTVIYTLVIYGALVLLVVSWNSPSTTTSSATKASPMRLPLAPSTPAAALGAELETKTSAAEAKD